jgi:hypothetical protein
MNVDDRTTVSDEELQAAIERMLALVEGLESACHSCACGKYYRLGMSAELQAVTRKIRRAIFDRTGAEVVADSTRFGLIEVD